ncbi:unnamed protein product [Mucor hiemalis]
MEVIVGIAEKSTEQFIQFFYPNYDTQRQNLGNLYRDTSAILWNGNAFGAQQYSEFWAACQCLTMKSTCTCGILINVTGTVKYGQSPSKRTFSQTFILMPDEKQAGNYYVQSDNFRLLTLFVE